MLCSCTFLTKCVPGVALPAQKSGPPVNRPTIFVFVVFEANPLFNVVLEQIFRIDVIFHLFHCPRVRVKVWVRKSPHFFTPKNVPDQFSIVTEKTFKLCCCRWHSRVPLFGLGEMLQDWNLFFVGSVHDFGRWLKRILDPWDFVHPYGNVDDGCHQRISATVVINVGSFDRNCVSSNIQVCRDYRNAQRNCCWRRCSTINRKRR